MNILYISNLTGNLFAGPNHSVPEQIKAQSNIDNVFWYNINNVKRDEWIQDKLICNNLSDYPSGRLNDLPAPFFNPDLAIIEEFYCYPFNKIIRDFQTKKIPYIVIPRSELTKQAQCKKKWKKAIGNILFFNNMARKAMAIQYLSQREYIESGNKWNEKYLIIPNGTTVKAHRKEKFSKNVIKAVYIGRYERYQKGLDILLGAIANIKDELRKVGFQLSMYGVDQEGAISFMMQKIEQSEIADLIHINDAVFDKEKEKILIQSDVFIMTSRFEGMPMGMIEALSFGLPCVATVGTNLSCEISEYEAGWTAKNTVDDVVCALKCMIRDYPDIHKKSLNAQKLSATFSWKSIAEESHNKYAEIIERYKK